MYIAKASAATGATSPLAGATISRRDPADRDVQIEILYCGICHSDLHSVRNEWSELCRRTTRLSPAMRSSVVLRRLALR